MMDRLMLDAKRVRAIAESVRSVRALPDPLGEERAMGARPNGLRIYKRRAALA